MNSVLTRIAELQSRFATPAMVGRVAGPDGFASALASAQSGSSDGSPARTSAGSTASTSANPTSRSPFTNSLTATSGSRSTSMARDAYATAPEHVPDAYRELRSQIESVAREEGVPASLLGALVWSESGFNPDAVSSAGARGLAQLMPATAEGLGVDIDNPADNLRGGARYLRQMLDRFGRSDLALAAYNAGPNAVATAGGIPPYEETQTYVARVLARAANLAGGNA